jgi:hypothetical protein
MGNLYRGETIRGQSYAYRELACIPRDNAPYFTFVKYEVVVRNDIYIYNEISILLYTIL